VSDADAKERDEAYQDGAHETAGVRAMLQQVQRVLVQQAEGGAEMTQGDIIRMAREAGSIDSEDVIETVYAAFSAAEREACAKVCDEMGNSDTNTHAWDAAAAIRARGADE
jgi:hypothetical protein